MTLTDTRIRNLKAGNTPQKISDGGGLHVLVTRQGSKLWRMAYRFEGKQKTLAFGAYPAVSLQDARQKRDEAKRILASDQDPSQIARTEKIERKVLSANTFNAIADEMLAKLEREGRSPATMTKKRWLLGMVRGEFGERPIASISAAEILVPLRRVEAMGNYETAKRLRASIGQVFRYAIATARAENDPTFGLRGALISPKVEHRAAIIDEDGFGQLVRAIWGYDGSIETQAILKLTCLLYPRPGELRFAQWEEFDFDRSVWTIPAARTKMRREHRKPLPKLAREILQDLRRHTGNRPYAFPSIRSPLRPISENTMNAALRRLGYTSSEMTSHGFRASASSLLNESGKWNPDAIEAELGHVGADQIRKAYHRAKYWDERVRMAEWWASNIEKLIIAPAGK